MPPSLHRNLSKSLNPFNMNPIQGTKGHMVSRDESRKPLGSEEVHSFLESVIWVYLPILALG